MNNQLVIKKSLAFSMTILLTLAILLSIVGSAMAQENMAAPNMNVPTAPSQAQGPTDPAELEAFLDDLFAKDMEENHIAGAAVSVVKDGKLFFAKGYGYADVEKKIPVDPEQTLFGFGSIGKVLTYTAVMQLAEQGKLDLDADINTYLDFHIPDTYPQPITLKHLMTHTSGFENRLMGSVVTDVKDLVPAREWLISNMHARVRAPGVATGYSNYNAMLAGYIVARVSGQTFEQYIQKHILDPLGMQHTALKSSMSPDLRSHASVGYMYVDGGFRAYPDYEVQPALEPSGAYYASATDLARFMIAHLQDGRYSDADIPEARILEEATAQKMHTTLYTPDPRLMGTKYGFFDFSDNGQRTIGWIGELPPMQSLLLLLPDQNLGVFIVYNSKGADGLTNQHLGFQRAFFDHYYSAPAVEPLQAPADFAERADRFVGSYRNTMGARTTVMKLMSLFGTVKIVNPGDGTLLLPMEFGELRFIEVAPLYFRQVDGPFGLSFREDDQGRITHMATDMIPQFEFEKLNWYDTPDFHMVMLLSCILIFLSMIPASAIHYFRDRRRGSDRKAAPRGARVALWLSLGISVLSLLFLAGFGSYMFGKFSWSFLSPVFEFKLTMKIVLGMGVLSAMLTVGALIYTVLAWKDRYWGIAFRAYYTLETVAAVAFVWFLNYWNLLGWRY